MYHISHSAFWLENEYYDARLLQGFYSFKKEAPSQTGQLLLTAFGNKKTHIDVV